MSAKYRIGSLVEFNKDKYTEEEGEYRSYNEKYYKGKQGYVMAISDTKVSTAKSVEQLAESGNAEYMYKIKVGLTDIENVPENDIFNPNESLTAKVEERLRKKQEGKTFADTEGRIGGSAKERAAYRLLKGQVYGLSDLEGIEADEATAIELIKKDKVYPKVDIDAERGKGVSSGAVFLKVKLREAYGGEPPNDKNKRKIYVGYATYLATAMQDIYSVEQFDTFRATKTVSTGIKEIIKILRPDLVESIKEEQSFNAQKVDEINAERSIINNKLDELYEKQRKEGLSDEAKDKIKDQVIELNTISNRLSDSKRPYDREFTKIQLQFLESIGASSSGSYWINRKIFEEVFGKRFVNFLTIGSDPVRDTIETAKDYEALTLPESLMLIEQKSSYELKRLEENKEKLVKVNTLKGKDQYDEFFKGNEGDTGFSGGDFWKWQTRGTKYFYYKDLKGEEQVLAYKKRYISNLEKRIEEEQKRIDAIKNKYRVRENNWEWAGVKKGKTTETDGKERSELIANTYPPLYFIKRTGGIKIEDSDITPVMITKDGKKFATYPKIQEHFGFANVELGQSLLDKEAKEHIRHFLGAMADFGDILNMNIVELNKLGGLSIAFASRGHGKASAHYEGLRKVINVTKTRGGGAIAHEYMHYLDNILPKIDRAEYSYKEYASVIKEGRYGSRSGVVANKDVYNAIDNIFQYIYKRVMPSINGDNRRVSEERIVKVKKIINLTDRNFQIPTSFYNSRTGAPKVPEDIEEYFNLFKERYTQYKRIENLKKRDIEVLGAIVKKFGFKYYEFEFETRNSQYYANSIAMGSDYWSREWELFARAFETYIFDKLDKLGRANNYLVSGSYFDRTEGIYPQGDERADLFILYDNLMKTIKNAYTISDFKAWTNERVDEYIALEGDKDETVIAGVIVDEDTDELIKKITPKKAKKNNIKKDLTFIKLKLKTLLHLLKTEKMETGGVLENKYEYCDKLNEFLLTLQN